MKKEGGAADEYPCWARDKSKNAKGSTVTYNTIKRARRKKEKLEEKGGGAEKNGNGEGRREGGGGGVGDEILCSLFCGGGWRGRRRVRGGRGSLSQEYNNMITVPVWYWPILSGLLGYCGLVLVSNPSTHPSPLFWRNVTQQPSQSREAECIIGVRSPD